MSRQLPFKFLHKPFMQREDYIISSTNFEAFSFVNSWQEWNSFAVCIYGPKGCGKTHLAHIFAESVSQNQNHIVPIVKASEIESENIHLFFDNSQFLVVEDLDEKIDEESIFHLYNLYKDQGGKILFTSKTAPARIGLGLKDLQSRLNSIPSIEIKEADSQLLSMLILKLFADRKVNVTPEVVSYIINYSERSFSYIMRLVDIVDEISISRKRNITIPIVKEALDFLFDDSQSEMF